VSIPFIDLKSQYQRAKENIDTAIHRVLDHGQYIMGPEVAELEKQLGDYIGVKHVVACSSGTDALVLPLMAKNLNKNDAVFTVSFTFFATAESVSLAGGTPVFVDIDSDTFNMDPQALEHAIEKVMVEGELTPNSFFPAKPLGCYGDGGAVFTNDDELYADLVSLRVHGQSKVGDKYDNVSIGLNARMDTIQAAVLLEKLKLYDDEINQRNRVANRYHEQLHDILKTPQTPEGYGSVWAQYSVLAASVDQRDQLRNALQEKGIPTAVYYPVPTHLSSAYASHGYQLGDLPVSEDFSTKIFSLPMHPYLEDEQIDSVANIIRAVV